MGWRTQEWIHVYSSQWTSPLSSKIGLKDKHQQCLQIGGTKKTGSSGCWPQTTVLTSKGEWTVYSWVNSPDTYTKLPSVTCSVDVDMWDLVNYRNKTVINGGIYQIHCWGTLAGYSKLRKLCYKVQLLLDGILSIKIISMWRLVVCLDWILKVLGVVSMLHHTQGWQWMPENLLWV